MDQRLPQHVPPSPADVVIARFGGIRPMAQKGGWPPSTVQGWKDSGYIPAHRQQEVLDVARREGVALSEKDFFRAAAA